VVWGRYIAHAKLKRDVALKVLPEVFTGDPQPIIYWTHPAANFSNHQPPIVDLEHPSGIIAIAFAEGCSKLRSVVAKLYLGNRVF
jgi:hypothetical protein